MYNKGLVFIGVTYTTILPGNECLVLPIKSLVLACQVISTGFQMLANYFASYHEIPLKHVSRICQLVVFAFQMPCICQASALASTNHMSSKYQAIGM